MHKWHVQHWLRQRANQRKLALGLLALAFGCFAQALWIEAKAELAQAFSDPPNTMMLACYVPETSRTERALRIQ